MGDAGTPSTAAPSAAPATAPAPSTPTSTPTSTSTPDVKRPANFGAALRHAEKEGSSPSTPASGESPAAGTVLPTDAASPGSPGPEGPVPYQRFSEVNKQKNAYEEKLKALAWAENLDQQALLRSLQWHAKAQQDPTTFFREIYGQAPPALQAQIRNLFVQAEARPNAPGDGEPQPDIQTDTGIPVYSARQQALREQWFQRKLMAEFKQMVAPLQEETQRTRQSREKAIQDYRTRTFAQTTAKDATEWPHFQDHIKPILVELQKLPPGNSEAEETLNLHRAYMTVYRRDILPGLNGKSEAAVLAELKTKAVAGSAHPNAGGTTAPNGREKTLGLQFRKELAKAGLR